MPAWIAPFMPVDDQVRGLVPPDMAQHHLRREHQGARIDFVLAAYLGAVPCVASNQGYVVRQIGSGRNADAADLGGQRIGQVVAIEVQVATTLYSLGRVSTCCSMASAITSLITISLDRSMGSCSDTQGPPVQ